MFLCACCLPSPIYSRRPTTFGMLERIRRGHIVRRSQSFFSSTRSSDGTCFNLLFSRNAIDTQTVFKMCGIKTAFMLVLPSFPSTSLFRCCHRSIKQTSFSWLFSKFIFFHQAPATLTQPRSQHSYSNQNSPFPPSRIPAEITLSCGTHCIISSAPSLCRYSSIIT